MRDYSEQINAYNDKIIPSVVKQYFPEITNEMAEKGNFYPRIKQLDNYFVSSKQERLFGALMMLGFLVDTIAVEHHLVIPVVTKLNDINFNFPSEMKRRLYNTVTDEGHHADQSLSLIDSIKSRFSILDLDVLNEKPLFLKKLDSFKNSNSTDADLICLINAVVTETRISKELGVFAKDMSLVDPVREFCETHQSDEVYHSLLFRWLGNIIWDKLNSENRNKAATYFANSIIARNYPDLRRMRIFLSIATGMTEHDATQAIKKEYNQKVINQELRISAIPTIRYLINDLNIMRYKEAKNILESYDLV